MDIDGIYDKIDLSNAEWVNGIPFPGMSGVEFMVRSTNYKPYIKARDAALRSLSLYSNDVSDDDVQITVAGIMADHLITDWRGVTMGGKPAEFSADLARRLFTADDPHGIGDRFRKSLDYAASSLAVSLLERREEVAGNSQKP